MKLFYKKPMRKKPEAIEFLNNDFNLRTVASVSVSL